MNTRKSGKVDFLTAWGHVLESVEGASAFNFFPFNLLLFYYRNCPTDPYKKFVGFYTRSEDCFVNYSLVLDTAMSLEVEEFGELTEEE